MEHQRIVVHRLWKFPKFLQQFNTLPIEPRAISLFLTHLNYNADIDNNVIMRRLGDRIRSWVHQSKSQMDYFDKNRFQFSKQLKNLYNILYFNK